MTTTAATMISLSPRERQVLERLATGDTVAMVGQDLRLSEGTVVSYLRNAKDKLYGVSETEAAVAIGLALEVIARPPLEDPEQLFMPREQRDLVPYIARGMTAEQMAAQLRRPVTDVRADSRDLLSTLNARNRPHLITRSWQFRLLTAEQVIKWYR
ncbi:LuxR C-terminal-related transcriptional regulator [Streptomyces rubradiris]|uniref:HTH luxR-type domain-containing protein n=1 Tax=Streptomyces rubradiris TaxID=285531 RepID=A0ABQ3RDF9_STRRR|nr:LuxR C-terminal-related transcriptional regulator [Streptomyces rubradiris]GHG95371.1 hypothetical protein GCM10018792_06110 [Streptomyces rubradiris]GHI53874.1 hypothetical protein Srubr_37200 [Streptomyces rubradiris]